MEALGIKAFALPDQHVEMEFVAIVGLAASRRRYQLG
jgi:hypothetical protein